MAATVTSPVPPAVPPAAPRARLEFIDGLRGAACLYVLLYHVFLLWPVSAGQPGGDVLVLRLLTKLAAFGHIGVNIFLALSGFCLFYPICRRAAESGQELADLDLGVYAARRARRILPPYFAALALFALLPALWPVWAARVHPPPVLFDLVTHLFLIHNLFPSTVLSINGPFWSLALEVQLYVLFPLLLLLFRRTGAARFALIVLGGCLLFRIAAWYGGGQHLLLGGKFALMNSLPGRVAEFAAGMVAAYLVTAHGRTLRSSRRFRALLTLTLVATPVAAYLLEKRTGEYGPLPGVFWGVFAGALIVGCAGHPGGILRVFSGRPLVWIGLFSYSIYLLHEPLLRFTGFLAGQAAVAPLPLLALFVVAGAPLLLALCYLFFLAFERPFLTKPPR